jgi:hypothetical protein
MIWFFVKVKGPYCMKARAMAQAEILETFGGRSPPLHYLTLPTAPAPVADADARQDVAIGIEPIDKRKRKERWDARVRKMVEYRDAEQRRNAAKVLEWKGLDGALPRRRGKRPRESNNDGERAAKRPIPDHRTLSSLVDQLPWQQKQLLHLLLPHNPQSQIALSILP